MRNRMIALLVALAISIACLSGICSAASVFPQEDVELDLRELMASYCGTRWYQNYLGAIQCKGFADMIFNELYGTLGPGPYSDNKYYLPDAESRSCICLGILSGSSSNYDSLKALLSQALPGDYVQCVRSTGSQHSMIVLEVSGTGITFFDCNLKGSYLCASYTYSWAETAQLLTRGISLYRHEGYTPTTDYRIYFNPNGGKCPDASKPVRLGAAYGSLPEPEREGYRFDGWYIERFSTSSTPTRVMVNAETLHDTKANVYLKAAWTEDLGPCGTDGHSWIAVETVSPTCESDGYITERCTVCNRMRQTDAVPASGHVYREIESVPATNVDDGSITYQCELCGSTVTEVLPSQLHRFTDLREDAWYYSYVRTVVADGLMNGTSDVTFEPDKALTRAMLVTVLYRMLGEPEAAAAAFSDVPEGKWFSAAIGWASQSGVVNGYPDQTFRPNAPVTREQAATILYRFAMILGANTEGRSSLAAFSDETKISDYAKQPMAWASACGILSGFPDETLRPGGNAARAQIAKMIVTLNQSK